MEHHDASIVDVVLTGGFYIAEDRGEETVFVRSCTKTRNTRYELKVLDPTWTGDWVLEAELPSSIISSVQEFPLYEVQHTSPSTFTIRFLRNNGIKRDERWRFLLIRAGDPSRMAYATLRFAVLKEFETGKYVMRQGSIDQDVSARLINVHDIGVPTSKKRKCAPEISMTDLVEHIISEEEEEEEDYTEEQVQSFFFDCNPRGSALTPTSLSHYPPPLILLLDSRRRDSPSC